MTVRLLHSRRPARNGARVLGRVGGNVGRRAALYPAYSQLPRLDIRPDQPCRLIVANNGSAAGASGAPQAVAPAMRSALDDHAKGPHNPATAGRTSRILCPAAEEVSRVRTVCWAQGWTVGPSCSALLSTHWAASRLGDCAEIVYRNAISSPRRYRSGWSPGSGERKCAPPGSRSQF
jgi:hypothetical protein